VKKIVKYISLYFGSFLEVLYAKKNPTKSGVFFSLLTIIQGK